MNGLNIADKPISVPITGTLDALSAKTWTNGIQIDQLNELDTLLVETMHHSYEIIVVNPATAEVLVRGGELFGEFTPARLSGASLRCGFLKLHSIYVGFNMELSAGGKRIVTSRVRNIRQSSCDETQRCKGTEHRF
jgi:hypothetical protein